MEVRYRNALTEISEIIRYSDDDTKDSISEEFIEFVERNKSKKYKSKITPDKPLEEQEILYETRVILAEMYRDFWANDEEKRVISQRMKLYEKLDNESKMHKVTINDDMFGTAKKAQGKNQRIAKVEEKTGLFYKIIDFIKNIIRGNG